MKKSDFWQSMLASQSLSDEARTHQDWALLKNTFDRWSFERRSERNIPKVIHQIWLGSPVPKLYSQWGETWKRLNPTWEYRLWTEDEIANFGLTNQAAFDGSPNFGVKSDLARYEILHRYGGVYADTDFECLAGFDELVESSSFFAGIMYGDRPTINNGLIGATPGHPILGAMVAALAIPFDGHDAGTVLAHSGPVRFAAECLDYLRVNPDPSVVIFPTSYFYPFPNREVELKDLKEVRRWLRPESLAVHYWEVSWRKQSFSSKVYWWMKKNLPRPLFVTFYRWVKGKSPE
jgi:mannosyltransferase OCH1-like enzyme